MERAQRLYRRGELSGKTHVGLADDLGGSLGDLGGLNSTGPFEDGELGRLAQGDRVEQEAAEGDLERRAVRPDGRGSGRNFLTER